MILIVMYAIAALHARTEVTVSAATSLNASIIVVRMCESDIKRDTSCPNAMGKRIDDGLPGQQPIAPA